MNAGDRPTFIDIENYFEDLIVNKCSNLYITVYDIPEGVCVCGRGYARTYIYTAYLICDFSACWLIYC